MLQHKRKNLLIVCAGDNSLHPLWAPYRQSFDTITIYFGSNPEIAEKYRKISDLFFQSNGLKISLAREILFHHLYIQNKFDFSHYNHIWFPDDDLRFFESDQSIENLFEVANASNADVFQPAIQNENFSAMWEPTRLVPGAFAHRTNIVEIMAHGFKGEVFSDCYLNAIHVCEFMKSGWGLEPIWTKIGEALYRRALRTYVFDCVPIIHTRPIGTGDSIVHRLGRYEATYIPQIYTNRMSTLSTYNSLQELEADQNFELKTDSVLVKDFHEKKFNEFLRSKRARTRWFSFMNNDK